MADLQLRAIDELLPIASTPFIGGLIPVASAGETRSLELNQFRSDLFANPAFTGVPTAPTPLAGNNTTQIATTAFVQAALSGAGLNPASNSSFGTVRTNTTDPVPVVYLKNEVDTLMSVAAATIRPIATGGTGGSTAAAARTNLGAAASGVNADITELSGLTAVPSVVSNLVASTIPPGTILLTARTAATSGWLICDGSAVSRTVFASLFGAIGTTYGAGDGSTTFNLPNLRGRVPIGAGVSAASGTNRSVATTGGADTHTLTAGEMPSHTHSTTGQFVVGGSTGANVTTGGGGYGLSINPVSSSAGSSAAHNNLQPWIALHYIIKT